MAYNEVMDWELVAFRLDGEQHMVLLCKHPYRRISVMYAGSKDTAEHYYAKEGSSVFSEPYAFIGVTPVLNVTAGISRLNKPPRKVPAGVRLFVNPDLFPLKKTTISNLQGSSPPGKIFWFQLVPDTCDGWEPGLYIDDEVATILPDDMRLIARRFYSHPHAEQSYVLQDALQDPWPLDGLDRLIACYEEVGELGVCLWLSRVKCEFERRAKCLV